MYKLFKFNDKVVSVIRLADSVSIPLDEQNSDYQAYLKWLDGYEMVNGQLEKTSGGNTPQPADTPA